MENETTIHQNHSVYTHTSWDKGNGNNVCIEAINVYYRTQWRVIDVQIETETSWDQWNLMKKHMKVVVSERQRERESTQLIKIKWVND